MNCGLADGLGKQHELDGGDFISSQEGCCAGKELGKEYLTPVFGCVGAGYTSQQPAAVQSTELIFSPHPSSCTWPRPAAGKAQPRLWSSLL